MFESSRVWKLKVFSPKRNLVCLPYRGTSHSLYSVCWLFSVSPDIPVTNLGTERPSLSSLSSSHSRTVYNVHSTQTVVKELKGSFLFAAGFNVFLSAEPKYQHPPSSYIRQCLTSVIKLELVKHLCHPTPKNSSFLTPQTEYRYVIPLYLAPKFNHNFSPF